MSHVGFHGSDLATVLRSALARGALRGILRGILGGVFGPQAMQAGDFHAVAYRCSRGMALHVIHVPGPPARGPVRRAHGPELTLGIRGQQVAAHVVGEPHPGQPRENAISVGQGVFQPFEHEDARAFAHHQAVRAFVQGRALARGRERAKLGKTHLGVECVGPAHAAGQHGIGASGHEFVRGQLERVERGRTRGIQRIRAAAKPEGTGHHRGGQPRHPMVDRIRARARYRPGRLSGDRRLHKRQHHVTGERRGALRGQGQVAQDHAHPARVHGLHPGLTHGSPAGRERQMEENIEPFQPRGGQRKSLQIRG